MEPDNILTTLKESNGWAEIDGELAGIGELERTGKVAVVRLKQVSLGRYVYIAYLTDHPCSAAATYHFKIPMDYVNVRQSAPERKEKLDIISTFFEKWICRREITKEETVDLVKRFSFDFCVVSVPEFLSDQLMGDFQEIRIIPNRLSPVLTSVSCDLCGHHFVLDSPSKIVNCPGCKRKIRVKETE